MSVSDTLLRLQNSDIRISSASDIITIISNQNNSDVILTLYIYTQLSQSHRL